MARTFSIPRPEPTTLLVAILCLGGFLTALRLLYADLRATGQAGEQGIAGVIEERVEDVQRRVSSSFLWNYAERGEQLYFGDAVRVGHKGAAVVRLFRGITLELQQNSLIVLEDWQDLPLHVLEGSSIVRADSGDSRVAADAQGGVQVARSEFRLAEPKPFARWHVADEAPRTVKFHWEKQQDVAAKSESPVHLQISWRAGFQGRPLVDQAVSGNEISVPLTPGIYYWRLARGTAAVSESRELGVRHVRALQPASPVDGARQELADDQTALSFRWAAPDKVWHHGQYALQIARDAAFRDLTKQIPIEPSRESARVSGLAPGHYFWRLQAKFSDAEVNSTPESFELVRLPKLEVRQEYPAEAAAFELAKAVPLRWEAPGAEAQYLVEWETAGASGRHLTGRNERWDFQAPVAGTYRWRVVARHAGREVASPWRSLHFFSGEPLRLTKPAPDARLEFWLPPPITFAWDKGEASGTRYRVEISPDYELRKNVTAIDTGATELTTASPLKRGAYFWRVTQLGTKGAPIRVSPIARFHSALPPRLPAPAALQPDDVTLDPVHRDRGARLTWSELREAAGYEIRIAQSGRAIWRGSSKSTSVPLPRLMPGRYQWSVFARDPAGRDGESARREFSIEFGETLPAPGAASAVEVP